MSPLTGSPLVTLRFSPWHIYPLPTTLKTQDGTCHSLGKLDPPLSPPQMLVGGTCGPSIRPWKNPQATMPRRPIEVPPADSSRSWCDRRDLWNWLVLGIFGNESYYEQPPGMIFQSLKPVLSAGDRPPRHIYARYQLRVVFMRWGSHKCWQPTCTTGLNMHMYAVWCKPF